MANDIQLPPQTFDSLKKANENIKGVKKFLVKAKLAGLDVGSAEKTIKDQETKVRKMRDGFFPGQTL